MGVSAANPNLLEVLHIKFSTKLNVKISFSSLNFRKSSFFVPKLSKDCFSFLNFTKHYTFHHSVYIHQFISYVA